VHFSADSDLERSYDKNWRMETQHVNGQSAWVAQIIRERIRPHLSELALCRSMAELLTSPVYQTLEASLDEVMGTIQSSGDCPVPSSSSGLLRVLAWNIERGKQLAAQVDLLSHHPFLNKCDVLLLTETDAGMARSGNVDVAATIAEELGFNYSFTPCYLSLVKGSGLERAVKGENDQGLHGNAILSRYPLHNVRSIPLPNGIDKMASNEKRIGHQRALVAEIPFQQKTVTFACVHLDANASQLHRAEQMKTVLDCLPAQGPVVIGGDWNTTTFNSSTAFHAIMGFWLRVFMGPGNVIRNHYLHPYRRFEKRLFQLLEERGYEYKQSNALGEHTIFYDVKDMSTHEGLAEWVPRWCFPFIRWALREHGGGCPLKIDWFATRGVAASNPRVFHEARERLSERLSDHDAITVDIVPT